MDNVRSVGKERNTCKFLGLKPEEESQFGRSKPRWKVKLRRLAGCGLDYYGWCYGHSAFIQILRYYIDVTMIIFQNFSSSSP